MNWHQITLIVIIGITITLALYDVLAAIFGKNEATISRVLYGLAKQYPIIPFGVGLIVGHLWWTQ